MSPRDSRVDRILTKLARARETGASSFGSDKHRFALNEPLGEEAIARFEASHGVALPAGYRAFLRHAGDGGVGPYYGIFRLAEWDDFATWVGDDVPADWLARPSPLTPSVQGRPPWGTVVGGERGSGSAWLDALGLTLDKAHQAYAGTLAIGSQGCSYETLLVVSGAFAGRVVYVDADHGRPPYFTGDADFLDWYERWLEEISSGLDTTWFGEGMLGDERTLVRAFVDESAPGAVRAEAARSLLRLPAVLGEHVALLRRALRDPSPVVRRDAVAALARFDDGPSTLAPLLEDDDATVRAATVRAIAGRAGDGWQDALRPLLRDPSHDVASGAIFALHKAKGLRHEDVQPLLDAPDDGTRSLAVWAGPWTAADVPRLAALLDDRSTGVRRNVLVALRTLRAREVAPRLVARLERETDVTLLEHVARALGALGDAGQALAPLVSLLSHHDDFVRLAAIEALGELGDPRAGEKLAPFLAVTTKPSRPGRGHTKTFGEASRRRHTGGACAVAGDAFYRCDS